MRFYSEQAQKMLKNILFDEWPLREYK